jgi:DNA-binding response OmpR family regulator
MAKPRASADQDRPTIVLLHDEPTICGPLSEALDEEGFAVVEVADVKDAAARASECTPDLVLIARLRQPLDGRVLRRLRTDPAFGGAPLVVVRGSRARESADIDIILEHVWRTINTRVLRGS